MAIFILYIIKPKVGNKGQRYLLFQKLQKLKNIMLTCYVNKYYKKTLYTNSKRTKFRPSLFKDHIS